MLAEKELMLSKIKNNIYQSQEFKHLKDELNVCKSVIINSRKKGFKII